jgi:cardiolipin synthase
MFEAIAAARDHVNIETYILDGGELGQKLAALLAEKGEERRQGPRHVRQRRLDRHAEGLLPEPARCRRRGVRIQPGPAGRDREPPQPPQDHGGRRQGGVHRRHQHQRDLCVVVAPRAREPGPGAGQENGWRDTQVRVEGPVVAQFQRTFLDDWALQDCGPWRDARFFPPPEVRGSIVARVVRSDPDLGESEMYASSSAGSAARAAGSGSRSATSCPIPGPSRC